MRLKTLALGAGFVLASVSLQALLEQRRAAPHALPVAPAQPSAAVREPAATRLEFGELWSPGGSALRPSAKALALSGQRVRMVGFMVRMELRPTRAFYLTAQPLHCDEAGAGTGDLPLESVLVHVPEQITRVIPELDGPLDVTGVFEIGNHVDERGFPSAFRIRLEERLAADRGADGHEKRG